MEPLQGPLTEPLTRNPFTHTAVQLVLVLRSFSAFSTSLLFALALIYHASPLRYLSLLFGCLCDDPHFVLTCTRFEVPSLPISRPLSCVLLLSTVCTCFGATVSEPSDSVSDAATEDDHLGKTRGRTGGVEGACPTERPAPTGSSACASIV